MQEPGALCLISGMAGSRQGWQEAPYCPCPAGFAELGQHLLWLQPGRIALVPGLSCTSVDALNTPDVMRGEEVQIFGALQLAGRDSATLVLPGTHSKWVQVQGGRVSQFQTFMTGEVFALMSQHSILGKTLDLKRTINIYSDRGYECQTEQARYDFGSGVLKGDTPIKCQGPLGVIAARRFEGMKDPGILKFSGGVSTNYFPAARQGEAATAATTNPEGIAEAVGDDEDASVGGPTPATPNKR
jgi:hypothetical protein